MVIFHTVKLNKATKVMLKTIPYDPLSIFRGRYVSLRYEISNVSIGLLKDSSEKDLKAQEEVFVLLEKQGDCWQAKGVYRNLPKDSKGLFLRGRLPAYYSSSYLGKNNELNINYGIESFFLNEVSADEIDKVNLRRPDSWQEQQRRRQELISQSDVETQRILKAGISKWWFDSLKKELDVWLKEGIIDAKSKDSICNKYAQAEEKLKEIERKVNPVLSSEQEPVIVEVAIDKNGYGYPARLFMRNKEYR
jgi:uncharacterized membrane-anchored protein